MRRKHFISPRRFRGTLIALLVIGGLFAADRFGIFGRKGPSADMETYHGKTFTVVHCVDGDTIDIDMPDAITGRATTRVRLWGTDTPETVKPNHRVEHFGPEASAFTRAATLNQPIHLKLAGFRTRGLHKRLLAYVFLPNGDCLNLLLIQKGLGYSDPRFEHPQMHTYKQAMNLARKEKIGLWRDPVPEDWPDYIKK